MAAMGDAAPEGLEVERVDWLPSGGRSGLIRVRGRWSGPGPLPELAITTPAGEERHSSLPDPHAGRDPAAWRGAYVVHADVVASSGDRMALVFPSGARVPLPAPNREALPSGMAPKPAPPAPPPAGGEVIDRAVLAERRARRAEAAEQAQARIAREALRAVEVLELRATELEERLEALRGERDSLAQRAGSQSAAAPPPELVAAPSADEVALRQRLAELEVEIDALRASPPGAVTPPDADRRVERLRDALSSAIVTIGDLRVALQDARVHRRTSEASHGADAVRLAVLLAEREETDREIAELRSALDRMTGQEAQLRGDLERATARAAGAEAAHEETRRQLADRSTQLAAAREQAAGLEAELAAARAESERIASHELPAAVAEAVERRERELRAEHLEAARAAEAAVAEARAGLERLEAELAAAETEREIAEATAAAATAERQAAEVAWATLADELAALRGGEVPPRPDVVAELERERAQRRRLEQALALAERAAQPADPASLAGLARSLSAVPPEPGATDQLVADLDAAAAGLRASTEAGSPGSGATPGEDPAGGPSAAGPARASDGAADSLPGDFAREPGGAADRVPGDDAPAAAPQAPGADPLQPGRFLPPAPPDIDRPAPFVAEPGNRSPQIVSPGSEPPTRVLRARGRRKYPPLRGALVKLAHDDPAAAAGILAGLLPAQGRVVGEPVDYDLTLAELGTYSIRVTPGEARVEAADGPRPDAQFHLRTDALTLAEMLTGFGPRPRRFGRAKLTGHRRRRVRALEAVPRSDLSLRDAARAGASLDPALVLRCFTYAVPASWTRGHRFTVAHTVVDDGTTTYLSVRDGGGLTVSSAAPAEPPDATVTMTAEAFSALLRDEEPPERPTVRGDHQAVDQLRVWADSLRGGPAGTAS